MKADVALNTAGIEKIRSENLRLRSTWNPFDSSFERKGALCPLWSVILKSVWNSVGDTFQLRCSWPWAVLCSLLCPETDWNIRVEKQGYVFILNNFKKWCFDACNPDNNQCVNNYLRLRKVEFIRWINLINVFFIGFVKFEINGMVLDLPRQFCVWFSLARLRTARELSKKEMALSCFFLIDYCSRTWLMPWQYFLVLIFCSVMLNII